MNTDVAQPSVDDEKTWHIEDTYVRIPRSVMVDVSEGLITSSEFLVLVWLTFQANPNDALVSTSYDGIVAELGFTGKNATNKVNKIMLSLKQKRYLWYQSIQGQKRGFRVAINNYLLSNKGVKDLTSFFEDRSIAEVGISSRKRASGLLRNYESTIKENTAFKQKLGGKNIIETKVNLDSREKVSRSVNNKNDNDKGNEIEKEVPSNLQLEKSITQYGYVQNKEPGRKVINYKPKNVFEEQLKKIAIELGEEKMDFILSAYTKYGMPSLIGALREVQRSSGYNEPWFKRGARFNYLLSERS